MSNDTILLIGWCTFEAISSSECPWDLDTSNDCVCDQAPGSICEADDPLPGKNGTTDYNIDNCGSYDVFRCVNDTEGKIMQPSFKLI